MGRVTKGCTKFKNESLPYSSYYVSRRRDGFVVEQCSRGLLVISRLWSELVVVQDC